MKNKTTKAAGAAAAIIILAALVAAAGEISGITTISGNGNIDLKTSGDTDDYIQISTKTNIPNIETVGDSDLIMNITGGDMYVRDNGGQMALYVSSGSTASNPIIRLQENSVTKWHIVGENSDDSFRILDDDESIALNIVEDANRHRYFVYDADGSSSLLLDVFNESTGASATANSHGFTTNRDASFFFNDYTSIRPYDSNDIDLGTSTYKWKNGYIVNAWTVGDLVFNYNIASYRIIEAEKLTNDKLKGLMYVMGDKAVMWIEPNGKLHTTQEIDTTWEGITGLSFDEDGGVYKDNEIVRYPVVGSGNETYLSPVFKEDGKKEHIENDKIGKVKAKPNKKPSTTTTLLNEI